MQSIIRTNKGGNDPRVKKLLSEGWTIKTTTTQGQGYGFGKTCCCGCIFLPLALLGRKKDMVEYIMEKPNAN